VCEISPKSVEKWLRKVRPKRDYRIVLSSYVLTYPNQKKIFRDTFWWWLQLSVNGCRNKIRGWPLTHRRWTFSINIGNGLLNSNVKYQVSIWRCMQLIGKAMSKYAVAINLINCINPNVNKTLTNNDVYTICWNKQNPVQIH